VEVIVLADTHLRGGIERLPQAVLAAAAGAGAIVHAGDVVSLAALEELRGLGKPVHAVAGNNDHELVRVLPEELRVELAGVRVAVVHDSGARDGRERRMAQRFPDAEVVVFGHSHVPWNEITAGGQLLFNPGSPTQRRAQPYPTFGRLVIEGGRIVTHDIEQLDLP
jgi:putative phosphoesterase